MKIFSCVFSAVVLLAAMLYISSPPLSEDGEKAVYYSQNSSGSFEKECDFYAKYGVFAPLKYFEIKGESVYVSGECNVSDVLNKYSATAIYRSDAGGVTCYYCYSPRLAGGVRLKGKTINLHIAVSGEGYTVGTPIIFGGF